MKRLLLAILFIPMTAHAMPCTVISVHDGDTFRCANGAKIRISQIDAPEIDQPYGKDAKLELSSFILGKTVDLQPPGKTFPNSYDRLVARVYYNSADIGAAMIEQGYAWASDKFYPPQEYTKFQDTAKAEHIGLWKEYAVEPWVWRNHEY